MSGGSHIVAVGEDENSSERQDQSVEGTEEALTLDEGWVEDEDYLEEEYGENPRSWRDWIVPSLAILAIIGWTALFGFVNHPEMLGGAPLAQWTEWVSQWAMPVALIVGLWLLAMRTSKREQARFADTSRLLADESAGLEAKLKVVNRELSLARDFIASQSRDLESLGRVATERLSENAQTLSGLIEQNGDRIDSIASVSTTARENMEKLRDELPVISNSSRDVTNQIGNAGRTAKGQVDELIEGLKRLNEFGAASDEQVKAVQKHASFALSQLTTQTDQLGKLAQARFGALAEQSQAFRAELDGHEVEALAALKRRGETLTGELDELRNAIAEKEQAALQDMQARIEELRQESSALSIAIREGESEATETWRASIAAVENDMNAVLERISATDKAAIERSSEHLAQIETHADNIAALFEANSASIKEALEKRTRTLEERETTMVSAMEQRLVSFDESAAERRDAIEANEAALTAIEKDAAERIEALREQGALITELGETAGNSLSQAIDNLRDRFEQGRDALEGTDVVIAGLTDASVRLLELIQASAQHSEEILPSAIHNAQATIDRLRSNTDELAESIANAEQTASRAKEQLEQAKESSESSIAGIMSFESSHAEHLTQSESDIASLKGQLEELDQRGSDVSKRLSEDLQPAVMALKTALSQALETVEAGSAEQIAKLSAKAGEESAATIEQAIRAKTADAIAQLESAALEASSKSREATKQMRDQLAMVAELTANLESRVAHARSLAQEQVDNDFARRVALITESLNSHAIDLSRALSTDVTDTAWASYLKGDRGIFTRRAVSLLDREESREIHDIYESDPDFREHVSRYIHDFEAMLRTLLSTRDGKSLSVTMLSSDMGKLYVALAQAIERLRT